VFVGMHTFNTNIRMKIVHLISKKYHEMYLGRRHALQELPWFCPKIQKIRTEIQVEINTAQHP
jgi:hypothetical protein